MIANSQIPQAWKIVKLREVCKKITDGSHFSPESKSTGYPYITVRDIKKDDKIDFENCLKISKDDFENLLKSDCKPFENDVLFSKDGTVGKVALINYDKDFVVLSSIAILRPNSSTINSKYLFHILKSSSFLNKALNQKKGVAIRRIILRDLKELEIPLPPLPEQQAIVAKIEELFSSLDKGIESLKTARQELKIYRQAVLKWAFDGKLTNKHVKDGELPKGWTRVNLKDICEIKRGKSKHRPRNEPSLFGGKYPFIQTGDIRDANGGYIKKYSQTYSEKGLQQSKLWPIGTLCITIAANIGETAILAFDACFPDSVVGLVCNEKLLLNKYTNYFFISHKSKLEELAPATAQKNINVDILEKVKIPLAPIEEQQAIVSEIEDRLSVCDKLEESIEQSLQQAEVLRQSILKQAFEGKLVPQYSNDNPAGVSPEGIELHRIIKE
ncbi:MAG: restriction endonuclease subunit S [Paludibacter sp.]